MSAKKSLKKPLVKTTRVQKENNEVISIPSLKDPSSALCLDAFKQSRQCLVFCSSKKATESQAEKVLKELKHSSLELDSLATSILGVFSSPTKQCLRLSACIRGGVAFHHAGLHHKQRELIELAFRKGDLFVICSTPTLAAGLDLPAFRVVVRDHKRFGLRGMNKIPVLEYKQMAGRAGRPLPDGSHTWGESILLANDSFAKEELREGFIFGEVESIFSKLAVEPVLRTYLLSLIAVGLINSVSSAYSFFSKTFYAHQFSDADKLELIIFRMLQLLQEWNMISGLELEKKDDKKNNNLFESANTLFSKKKNNLNANLSVTYLGQRVSEMYLDPLTAFTIFEGLEKLSEDEILVDDELLTAKIIHLVVCSLELRPLLRAGVKDDDRVELFLEYHDLLISQEDFYELRTDNFEDTIKTTLFLLDWMSEKSEDYLMDAYGVRPGEIAYKQQTCDWLLYACEELSRISNFKSLLKVLKHLRLRIKHGVSFELLPLLRFKGIGRVRARVLFNNGVKNISDVGKISFEDLSKLVGVSLAKDMKSEVGEVFCEEEIASVRKSINANKPKEQSSSSQKNLGDF